MATCRPVRLQEQLAGSARYELLLRLAAGGMGSVFVGVDRRDPSSLRAIKRAHPHLLEDAYFRKMFAHEARLALRVDHPNAIGVLDVDDSDGELLMVMRYVEGASLAELLRATARAGTSLPRPAVLRVIADAARGLEAAHALRDESGRPAGIIHRDVSPHNILVGITGVASIVDFGVAKARALPEITNTASNVLKGKIGFMSPEYLRAESATPRSDVFSLGIVAWEALTEARLFRGESDAETMQRILSGEEAPSLDEVAEVDTSIARVIARALAKDPNERFSTAGAFADALEAVTSDTHSMSDERELAAAVIYAFGDELEERRAMLGDVLARRAEAMTSPDARKTARFLFRQSMGAAGPNPARQPTDAPAAPGSSMAADARPTLRMSFTPAALGSQHNATTTGAVAADAPVATGGGSSVQSRLLTTVAVTMVVGTTLGAAYFTLRGGTETLPIPADAESQDAPAPRFTESPAAEADVAETPPAAAAPAAPIVSATSAPIPSQTSSPQSGASAKASHRKAPSTSPPAKRPSWDRNPYEGLRPKANPVDESGGI